MADSRWDDLAVEDRARRLRQDQRADRIAVSTSGAEWLGRVQAIAGHKGPRCGKCLGPTYGGRCFGCRG